MRLLRRRPPSITEAAPLALQPAKARYDVALVLRDGDRVRATVPVDIQDGRWYHDSSWMSRTPWLEARCHAHLPFTHLDVVVRRLCDTTGEAVRIVQTHETERRGDTARDEAIGHGYGVGLGETISSACTLARKGEYGQRLDTRVDVDGNLVLTVFEVCARAQKRTDRSDTMHRYHEQMRTKERALEVERLDPDDVAHVTERAAALALLVEERNLALAQPDEQTGRMRVSEQATAAAAHSRAERIERARALDGILRQALTGQGLLPEATRR